MKETFYLVQNEENYLELHSENWYCTKITHPRVIPYRIGHVSSIVSLEDRLENKRLLYSFDFENYTYPDKYELPDIIMDLIPEFFL